MTCSIDVCYTWLLFHIRNDEKILNARKQKKSCMHNAHMYIFKILRTKKENSMKRMLRLVTLPRTNDTNFAEYDIQNKQMNSQQENAQTEKMWENKMFSQK